MTTKDRVYLLTKIIINYFNDQTLPQSDIDWLIAELQKAWDRELKVLSLVQQAKEFVGTHSRVFDSKTTEKWFQEVEALSADLIESKP